MKRTSFLLALAAGGLFLLLGTPVNALTIVPPSLEYNVTRGQTVNAKIKLFNEGQTVTTVFASVSNFTAKGENGEPDFQFEDTPTGTASWMDVPSGPLTVQPNDRIEIPVTISVPANAEPGGHYASVFFGTDPSLEATSGGQVTIRNLIGTLVILRVDGEVRESASLASFGVDGNHKTLTNLPVDFLVRIRNTGNVHLRPQGTITVKNLIGGETASLNLNDANGAVLPDSIRAYTVTWKKVLDEATAGNFFQQIAREWNNFAIGPYTATASITYGASKQNLVATTTVTILPWELLTVVIVGLVVIILAIVFGLKAYNRAIIRRAQGGQTPPTLKR